MAIIYRNDIVQGSDEWHAIRCGILTASEVKTILTPTLKIASNDKERAHVYELLAQRITGFTEPSYISEDMLRGMSDEADARDIYSDNYEQVDECGIVLNDDHGFTIGFSPDGLVGEDGLIEIKSRRQKFQVQSILENVAPDEYMLQLQTGLLVTQRKWIDYITYSAGLPMLTLRVYPDEKIQAAIVEAATVFHEKLSKLMAEYEAKLADKNYRLIPTERKIEEEIVV